MAPSMARVVAGMNRKRAVSHEKSGHCSAGRLLGMPPNLLPIVSTGSLNTATTTVAATKASTEPGTRRKRSACVGLLTRRGIPNCQATISASEPSASRLAARLAVGRACTRVDAMPKNSPGSLPVCRPKKSFTCDSAMSTAMPLVKPMITEIGIKRTSVPNLNTPMANSMTPDMAVAITRLARP